MISSYIQVPPDSSGKKLLTNEHVFSGNTVQVQAYTLVDKDLPGQGQHVDFRGAASVSFSEGSPQSAGSGGLKISENTIIGLYDFVVDAASDIFSDTTLIGGTVTRNADTHTMELAVTSTNGSFASRISDKYHYYMPGTSNLILMTVALSDSSHAGTERRWGMFDISDGIYFDLDDTGALKVTIRSSTSGSVVRTHVLRADWNGDKVDGTGLSGFNLDLTKVNIYWMDYQWLGAGRVRFGVVDDYGNRIVVHTFLNANHNLVPFMRTGSLPIQINIENKTATAGAASIRLTCSSVQTEGKLDYTYWRYNYTFPSKLVSSSTYLGSLKSKETINSDHNGVNVFPETLSLYITGGAVRIDVVWDFLTIAGTSFSLDNGSSILGDTTGSVTLAGTEYYATSFYLETGSHTIDLAKYFEITDIGLSARSDVTLAPQYVAVVATAKSGIPTVESIISYREVR